MAGQRWFGGAGTHFLEEHRIPSRIGLTGLMGCKESFLIVGVVDQSPCERLHFTRIHGWAQANMVKDLVATCPGQMFC
ncbi:MAG TPA: hypothetical protein VKP30_11490, partial [Polyangiaceae bacterium]|nr:hypothetical protein [Polyangiaceae bacterium]